MFCKIDMVGSVITELEGLDPHESAVVKMATVFEGPFSVEKT